MPYEPTNWKSGDVVTSAKLNKLEEAVANASGGGSELPVVTSDDNGDVLTVVEGAWAKAVPLPVAYVIPGTYADGDVIPRDYDDVFSMVYGDNYIVLFAVEFTFDGGSGTDLIAQVGSNAMLSLTGKTTVTLTEGEEGYTVSVTPVGE